MKSTMSVALLLYGVLLAPCPAITAGEDSLSVAKSLDPSNDRFEKAFMGADAEQFLSCWTPDAVFMVDQVPEVCGQRALRQFFLDATGRLRTGGLDRLNRSVGISGSNAYETGLCEHRFSESDSPETTTRYWPYATVWNRQSDGAWKRAVEIWNERPAPSSEELDQWRKQTAAAMPSVDKDRLPSAKALDPAEATKQILALEKSFHDFFLTQDVEPAIDMYADDARLLSAGTDWRVGKEQIREAILHGRKQAELTNIQRDTLATGGDGNLVFVANRFHWQFKLPATGDQVHEVFGKGLHVWRCDPNSEWKLLIDVNNMNPAKAGSD